MLMSRRGPDGARSAFKVEWLVGALVAASIGLSNAHAASFGHSRIVSGVGQPLHIEIPVTQLTEQETQTLRARPAPAQAWREAGMTPPVALESMRLVLLDGHRPGTKVIQLRSSQPFSQSIVDVLLDVQTVSGQQRYQVSLVASADTTAVRLAVEQGIGKLDGASSIGAPVQSDIAGKQIRVRQRDTMFAVAQRNAVAGVTVYQLMMGLQRANPKAFIEDNVNLVRADAVLTMPDLKTLTALSDREARRLFLQHVQAFNEYRRRGIGAGAVAMSTSGVAVAQGELSPESETRHGEQQLSPAPAEDRLRLSASPDKNAATSPGGSRPRSGNLLASSGVIATDAMPERGPHAVSSDAAGGRSGFSSGVGEGGTALQADGAGSADPDDEAALRKGMAESQSRIIELEDNVRHLNEALQKQGHVAAETALEGVREVGEVIKEIIKLVEPAEEGAAEANGAAAARGQAGTAGGGSGDNTGAAGGTGTGSTGDTGTSNGIGSTTTSEDPAVVGSPGTAASTSGAATGASGNASDASGNTSAEAENLSGTPGVSPEASEPNGGASATSGSASGAGLAGVAGNSQNRAASAGSSSSSTSSAGGAVTDREGADLASDRHNRSWFWDNIIAVIGVGLALIVALVVWLLRRGSRPRDDAFESDSPITDTMVREKLRDIDLDLNDSSEPGRPRR